MVRNLDRIIDWATAEQSTIGYFAVLYKRSTVAIRDAIDRDLFENSALMAKFDAVFAQRYFDALNAYFHPDEFAGLNLAWEVAFVGHDNPGTTMIQQMLAGLNAHICFDLGVAAATVAPTSLRDLKPDFDRITDVVGTQVPGMTVVFERLSPGFPLGEQTDTRAAVGRRGAAEVPHGGMAFRHRAGGASRTCAGEAHRPGVLDGRPRCVVPASARAALDAVPRAFLSARPR